MKFYSNVDSRVLLMFLTINYKRNIPTHWNQLQRLEVEINRRGAAAVAGQSSLCQSTIKLYSAAVVQILQGLINGQQAFT